MGILANWRARRSAEEASDYDALIARLSDPRNAVSAFKQRTAEDPEYEAGFIKAMMSAKEEADNRAAKLAEEYFKDTADESAMKRRETYALVAGSALAHIIDTVWQAAENEDNTPLASETFLFNIGEALLELADEAYFAGSISMQNFRQGALAINDSEFGTLIAWDRAVEAGMSPDQMGAMSYMYKQLNGGDTNS